MASNEAEAPAPTEAAEIGAAGGEESPGKADGTTTPQAEELGINVELGPADPEDPQDELPNSTPALPAIENKKDQEGAETSEHQKILWYQTLCILFLLFVRWGSALSLRHDDLRLSRLSLDIPCLKMTPSSKETSFLRFPKLFPRIHLHVQCLLFQSDPPKK